jgi:PAS domain S-box-containing protein
VNLHEFIFCIDIRSKTKNLAMQIESSVDAPDAEGQPGGSIGREDETDRFDSELLARSDYQMVFDSCGVGMAVTSMSGTFVDCNQLFCHLSGYSKKELCSLTLFSLTAKKDLERAFGEVTKLILKSAEESSLNRSSINPITVQGSMKTEKNLLLNISLVRDSQNTPKGLCITLVNYPWSASDDSPVLPVSFVEY